MDKLADTTRRLAASVTAGSLASRAQRRDRGDVPGWVLITVMTAALVAAIWFIAEPQIKTMVQDALTSSNGKG